MIEVTTCAGVSHQFEDAAAKWKIDEERQLHIYKDGQSPQLGSYGANQWQSVRSVAAPAA